MKKLLALTLILCMVIGLVACTKKPAETNPTGTTGTSPTTGSAPTTGTTSFKGKTLQIYGFGTAETYTDYDAFGKGNYLWMQKAAIDEWAYINGVTIKYMGAYNQNQMLAQMQSGEKPDLFFQSNFFPAFANYGISGAFTEEEYNEIAEICGTTGYLDLMKYKGQSHGFVVPWVGNSMYYYNKSMFERYDVKTPKEYFMEDNWTWTTFQQCLEAMTKDLNADGVTDTYGMPSDSFSWGGSIKEDPETGKLLAPFTVNEQYYYDQLAMRYDQRVTKKTILIPGTNKIQQNVTYPMYAMQNSDCEPYNFEHLYQTLPNGDELEVVPAPRYDGEAQGVKTSLNFTQSAISLCSATDDREAAMDLIKYLLKCGMKYISDFSLGTRKCDYAGIQGTSELSAKWKEAFGQVCKDRAEAFKEIDFDQELMDKIYAYFETCEWTMYHVWAGVTAPNKYSEINNMPPASSIPAIKEKMQANLDKYNDLYIFD